MKKLLHSRFKQIVFIKNEDLSNKLFPAKENQERKLTKEPNKNGQIGLGIDNTIHIRRHSVLVKS